MKCSIPKTVSLSPHTYMLSALAREVYIYLKTPLQNKHLNAFEDDMYEMIRSIEFRNSFRDVCS